MSEQQSAPAEFRVVHNDEEQYSVWWTDRDLPAGWYAEGTEGTREACLAHIDEIWTDMRPASLRRRMAEQAAG
ncbi:MbtH family protein [Kitasatospora sp. NPDC057542]|uniref:MbtH family protein n=1 Tax=Streptomycetaceae TaxID=2062 RepID=UPI001CC92C4F|nr:MbtH family NRPS accessory protein [Streptomyces sp. LS1784]